MLKNPSKIKEELDKIGAKYGRLGNMVEKVTKPENDEDYDYVITLYQNLDPSEVELRDYADRLSKAIRDPKYIFPVTIEDEIFGQFQQLKKQVETNPEYSKPETQKLILDTLKKIEDKLNMDTDKAKKYKLKISEFRNYLGSKDYEVGFNRLKNIIDQIENNVKGNPEYQNVTSLNSALNKLIELEPELEENKYYLIDDLKKKYSDLINLIENKLNTVNNDQIEFLKKVLVLYYHDVNQPDYNKEAQYFTVFTDAKQKMKIAFDNRYVYTSINGMPFTPIKDNTFLMYNNDDILVKVLYSYNTRTFVFYRAGDNKLLSYDNYLSFKDAELGFIQGAILQPGMKITNGKVTKSEYVPYIPPSINEKRFLGNGVRQASLYLLAGLSGVTVSFSLYFTGKRVYKKLIYK